jgi:hypothetical protein
MATDPADSLVSPGREEKNTDDVSDDTMSISDPPVAIGGGPCSRGLIRGAKTVVFVSDAEIGGDIESKVPAVEFEDRSLLVFLPPFEVARRKWLDGDMPGVVAANTVWESFVALLAEDIRLAWSAEYGLETRVPLPVCLRPTVQEAVSPESRDEQSTGKALVQLLIDGDRAGVRSALLVAMSNTYNDGPTDPRLHLIDVRLPDLARPVLASEALQAVHCWRSSRAQAETVLEFQNFFDPEVIAEARRALAADEVWQSHWLRAAQRETSDDRSVFMVTFALDKKTFVTLNCTPGN